jgi:hypothetical protein
MTCYMGHMAWLFADLGIPYDAEGRKCVDEALRQVLRMPPAAKCPEIWRLIKDAGPGERVQLAESVREVLNR